MVETSFTKKMGSKNGVIKKWGQKWKKWGHGKNGVKSTFDPCSKLIRVKSRLDPSDGIFPRNSSEPNTLKKQIEKHNEDWKGLDCEIEDLLGSDFIELFLDENPNALRSTPVKRNGRCHYEWTDSTKGRLFKFTEQYANLTEINDVVEVLKSLRFYLGLRPEGV